MTNMIGNREDIVTGHNGHQRILDGTQQNIPGHIWVRWYNSMVMEIKGIIFDGIQQEIKRYTSNEWIVTNEVQCDIKR